MKYGNLLLVALIGASLGACDRAAPRTADNEPQTLASGAASPPQEKAPPVVADPAAKPKATPETISDAFITGAVRAAVMGDPGLAGSDVSVNTSHGVVSLTGYVKSREQAAIAAARAEGEDGVMRVDNTLVVLND